MGTSTGMCTTYFRRIFDQMSGQLLILKTIYDPSTVGTQVYFILTSIATGTGVIHFMTNAKREQKDFILLKGTEQGRFGGSFLFCTGQGRSEEHTSELQSRQYLVCRLLLEKKKKKNKESTVITLNKMYVNVSD